MSSEYSAEFKAKVALDAVAQNNKVIAELSEKYGVTKEEIISWTLLLQKEAVTIFSGSPSVPAETGESEINNVEITSDDEEFVEAVEFGAQKDTLDFKKLAFWSGLGVAVITIFIVALVYFAEFSLFNAQKNATKKRVFVDITKLRANQQETLDTFGVVNLEKGIYRIPITEAINKLAKD